jgi:FkbM family methyltransferase
VTGTAVRDLKHCLAPFIGANAITVARHGLFMVASHDSVIGRAMETYGEFAEDENELLLNFVGPGQTAVDVGANIGTVAVPLARKVGPTGAVLAIEPQRRVFTLLCANLALNGLNHVRPVFAALGAASGTARIAAPSETRQANLGAVRLDAEDATEEVSVRTLDSLGVASCALIKIDVEGMELQVLNGADGTIARFRPVIYFEAKTGDGTKACIKFLQERNYSLYWHFAPFCRPNNFRDVTQDIFRTPDMAPGTRMGDINALAIPAERDLRPRLPPVSGPDAVWSAEIMAWQRTRGRKPAPGL